MATKPTQVLHGGSIHAIEKKYGIHRNEIIDFSSNINPLGIPGKTLAAIKENVHLISTYPDDDYSALKEKIGQYAGAAPHMVMVGNGATELISIFLKLMSMRTSLIVGPAYLEYEREIKNNRGEYAYFALEEADLFQLNLERLYRHLPVNGLVILCNPNNPTGTALTCNQMKGLLTECRLLNTWVLVDETYCEFADEIYTSIPLTAEFDNLFVIRGTSKFFSVPGLRLGYGVCGNQTVLSAIKRKKDPWSVNTLAAIAGESMFADRDFIHKSKEFMQKERTRVFDCLSHLKQITCYPSICNFILLKTHAVSSNEIFEKLIQQKIYIRDASNFMFLDERYIRFCLLHTKQNDLLINALTSIL